MYSKHAKCMLMENFPNADFEVCFYNGRCQTECYLCQGIVARKNIGHFD